MAGSYLLERGLTMNQPNRTVKNVRTIISAVLAVMLLAGNSVANIITNPGFETEESISIFEAPGVPLTFGDWGGDLSKIVLSENGITPRDGVRMLRFDAAGSTADPILSSCDVHQLIDVSAFSVAITAGLATANASVWYNRVEGDDQTDTRFKLTIYALTGSPASYKTQLINGSWLDSSTGALNTDGNVETWEQANTSLLLPVGTDFLGLRIMALENIHNDGVEPEFDGHYADSTYLDIYVIPEPTALALLLLGGLALLSRRRFGSAEA